GAAEPEVVQRRGNGVGEPESRARPPEIRPLHVLFPAPALLGGGRRAAPDNDVAPFPARAAHPCPRGGHAPRPPQLWGLLAAGVLAPVAWIALQHDEGIVRPLLERVRAGTDRGPPERILAQLVQRRARDHLAAAVAQVRQQRRARLLQPQDGLVLADDLD